MIIVTGTVLSKPDTLDELLRLSLEHVHRSRAEPGCISHDVHLDAENKLRLVFVERWNDLPALHAHFAMPASRGFAKAAAGLCAEAPQMQMYEATEIQR
jgi:quinol monooxygenase YgiN